MKSIDMEIFELFLALTVLVIAAIAANGQSGGQFTVAQSVIAGGGSTVSTGGHFSVAGTTGQPFAGGRSFGPALNLHGGFWQPAAFSPTAALVSIGGQATTADGRGIKGVVMVLTESSGAVRTALSGPFGYYSFNDVPAGQTVVVNVEAKRYTFIQPATVISVIEDATDVNFVAGN